MQLARAAHDFETLVRARAQHGRSVDVEQVDVELGEACTACAFIYFRGDDEPMLLLVDLEQPMDENTFELNRDALLLGLLSVVPVSPVH